MFVARIDFLIYGYREFTLDEKDLKNALNLLLNSRISVKVDGCRFFVSERKFKIIEKLFLDKISYSVSATGGFLGLLKKYKSRVGLFSALILSLFFSFFASTRIWDIRIDGASPEKQEEIIKELEELGFSVGASFRKTDKAKIETQMLSTSENVSWININQRGTVAYVKVIEKLSFDAEETKEGFANIVAARDCIIEEITVKKGIALVAAGETVKKGQILISGAIPFELGGGFCYAEGVVTGRYVDEISVTVPEKETVTRECERKLYKNTIKFFDFSFKFLKRCGKKETKYDIIKEKQKFMSFLGKRIPVSLEQEYCVFYEDYEIFYTKDEMTRLASSRMRDTMTSHLSDKSLLKLKTDGKFEENNYVLVTHFVVTADVSEVWEFDFLENRSGE